MQYSCEGEKNRKERLKTVYNCTYTASGREKMTFTMTQKFEGKKVKDSVLWKNERGQISNSEKVTDCKIQIGYILA